ncbi:sensor histidine kinase [Georgenia deserti]|uniref:histidine kinase n=1 Tax=Georgenia deserti TaxID=2093781 RepID=A0ABW4L5L1_9MICO
MSEATRITPRAPAPGRGGVAPARRITAVVLIVVALPLTTVATVALRDAFALGSLLLLYLLAVVVIAAIGGLLPGLVAAAVSFALANWFLTIPYYTLQVAERDAIVELSVFVVVAAIVSALVELGARDRAAYRERLAEQAAATRELEAADRVRSALIAAVGHDLRTPLAGTKAAVSTLRQDDVDYSPEQRENLLATIEESTDRLTRVITNLLDMSRLQSGALTARHEQVELEEVLARVLDGVPSGAVAVELPDALPPVRADAALLERVLDNLVQNAVRYSPAGTPVEITAAVGTGRPEAEAEGGTEAEEDTRSGTVPVDVRVIDHGPGVPPEAWERMFVPLQRLDDRGTDSHVGLGLAIADGLAGAMGATLTPSQTPGGGLTMSVALPVALPMADDGAAGPSTGAAGPGAGTGEPATGHGESPP